MSRKFIIILLAGVLILAACAPQSMNETEPAATSPATGAPAVTTPPTDSPDAVVTSPSGSESEQPSPAPWQPSAEDKSGAQSETLSRQPMFWYWKAHPNTC
jgi:hypothetical protein